MDPLGFMKVHLGVDHNMRKGVIFSIVFFLFLFLGSMFYHVEANNNITVRINGLFDEHTQGETFISSAFGSKVQLTPTIPSGHEFAFWIVNGVVRQDLPINHNFPITNKLNLQPVFNRTDRVAVVFIDSNGVYLGVKYASKNANMNDEGIPVPIRPGYRVAQTKWASAFGDTSLNEISNNSVFVIQYESDGTIPGNSLQVTGGSGSGNYNFNSRVTVVAGDAGLNEVFSHWSENGVIVSYSPTYTFTLLKPRDLVAEFRETAVSQVPLVSMSGKLTIRSGHESYLAQYLVPEEFEVIEYGFLVSKSSEQLTIGSAGVLIAQSNSISPIFEFVTSFTLNTFRSFRAYIVVIQGDGAPQYIYSEVFQRDPLPEDGYTGPIHEVVKVVEDNQIIEMVRDGNAINNFTPTKEGHTFIGWFANALLTQAHSNPTPILQSMTLYAKFVVNYGITYELNGGINNVLNPSVYITEEETTLSNPTKEGHTFAGWYDNIELTGTPVTSIPIGSTINVSLYAKWTINEYTITFNSNEGTSVNAITANFGSVITEPTKPTKELFTFGGWYTDITLTTPFTFTTMPAESITLYARWLNDQDVTQVVIDQINTDVTSGAFLNLTVPNLNTTSMETAIKNKVTYLENLYGVVINITSGSRSGSTYNFTMVVTKNNVVQSIENITATFN